MKSNMSGKGNISQDSVKAFANREVCRVSKTTGSLVDTYTSLN